MYVYRHMIPSIYLTCMKSQMVGFYNNQWIRMSLCPACQINFQNFAVSKLPVLISEVKWTNLKMS